MMIVLATIVLATPAAALTTSTPTDDLSRRPSLLGEQRPVHPVRAVGVEGCVAPLRRAVVALRASTWRWEDKMGIQRHPTARSEQRATGCRYLRWMRKTWAQRDHAAWKRYLTLREPVPAILFVFGRWGQEALRVSSCETGGTFDTKASNGQYLGLFQMGSGERARYGHGNSPLEQARAAWRYFAASGHDWSPWSCQP